MEDSIVERKEEYKHLPSKFLVNEIEIMEINSDYCLEIDLLNKIILVQRTFRKYLGYKSNIDKMKKKIIVNENKGIEKSEVEKDNNVYSNSSEDTKSDLMVILIFHDINDSFLGSHITFVTSLIYFYYKNLNFTKFSFYFRYNSFSC